MARWATKGDEKPAAQGLRDFNELGGVFNRAPVLQDPLCAASASSQQADVDVGRRPGGLPYNSKATCNNTCSPGFLQVTF
jgi:hypothetical protein